MISSLHASNRKSIKRHSSSSSLSSLHSCFSVEPQFRDEFEVRNIAQFFRKHPFSKYFSDLNEEQILSVSKSIRMMSMRPLQLLIPKGGTFSRFYIVMEGYLNVNYGGMLDGQFMHLLLGETIGSQSLIFDQEVDYTVHSGKDGCVVCYLERDDFMRILKLHESFRVQKVISILRGAQLLKSTSEEQVFKLFYACNLLEIEPNKLLYSQGHKTNGFFIVLEGQLSIDRRNNSCNKQSEESTKSKEIESVKDNNLNKIENEQPNNLKGKCLFVQQGDYFGHLELLEREDKRRETVVNLQGKAKLLYLNNSLFNLFFNSSTQLANILENEQLNNDQGGTFMCRSISPRKKQIKLSIQLTDENNTSKTTRSSTTLDQPSNRQKYEEKKSQLIKLSKEKDNIMQLPISVLRLQAKLDSTRNNSRLFKNSDEKDQNQVIITQDAFTSPIDKDENFKGYLDQIETKRRIFTSEWHPPSQKHITESNILSQITGKIDVFEEIKGKLLFQSNKNKTCNYRSRSLGKRAELEVICPPVASGKTAEIPQEKGGFESVHQKRYLTEQFQKYEKNLQLIQKTNQLDDQGGKNVKKVSGQFDLEDQEKIQENDCEVIENHRQLMTLPETDDLQNMLVKLLQRKTPLSSRQSPCSQMISPVNKRNYFSTQQQQKSQLATQSGLSSPLASAIGSPISGRSKTIEGISSSYSSAIPRRKKKIVSTTYKIISSTHTLNKNQTGGNISELSSFSVGLASPRSMVKVPCQQSIQKSFTKGTDTSTDNHNSQDNLKPLLKEQISSNQVLQRKSQNSLNQVTLSDKDNLIQNNNNNPLYFSKQNMVASPSSQITDSAQPLWINPRSLLNLHSHNEQILQLTQQMKTQSDQPEQPKNQEFMNIQELITPLESFKQKSQPQQAQFISTTALNTKHHHSHASLTMHQFQLPLPMKETFKKEKSTQNQHISEEQASPLAQIATQEHNKLLLTMKHPNQNAMFSTKNLKDVILKQTMSEFVKSQISSIQANQTSVILQKMMTSYTSRSKQNTQTNASRGLISSIGDPSFKCETTPKLRNNQPKLFKMI